MPKHKCTICKRTDAMTYIISDSKLLNLIRFTGDLCERCYDKQYNIELNKPDSKILKLYRGDDKQESKEKKYVVMATKVF